MWLLRVEESEGTTSVINGRWMAEFASTLCLLMSLAAIAAVSWWSRQVAWPICPLMEFCVSGAAGVDASAETHCGIDFLRESAAQENMADFSDVGGMRFAVSAAREVVSQHTPSKPGRLGAGVDDWDAGTLQRWNDGLPLPASCASDP